MDGSKTLILRLEYPQLFDSGAGPGPDRTYVYLDKDIY